VGADSDLELVQVLLVAQVHGCVTQTLTSRMRQNASADRKPAWAPRRYAR
jgi:hypothetical protein